MALKVSGLNGVKGNKDKILNMGAYGIHTEGVLSGLQVTTNNLAPGTALIEVVRTSVTPNESFFVFFENTTNVTIDTSGTKKVWIEIPQLNINDAGQNSADGTGIAVIGTGASYPASNYIPLASITGGVITDHRSFPSPKEDFEKRGILLPKCTVENKNSNYTFSGNEANNTCFSTDTTSGNITYTLSPSLFPTTNGLFEFTFCKTSGSNNVIIDVGIGKTIDTEQTYTLSNTMETVTLKIVDSSFVKVVATTNNPIPTQEVNKFLKSFTVGETFIAEDTHYIDYDGKTYKFRGLEEAITQVTGVTFGAYTVCMVDTNTVLLVWGNSTYLSAKAGTVNIDGSITWGTATLSNFSAVYSSGNYLGAVKINTNKAAIAFPTNSGSSVTSIILSVSGAGVGATVTNGTASTHTGGFTLSQNGVHIVSIDTDKYAIGWATSTILNMVVCTVSGTTITAGTISQVASTTVATTVKILKLSTNKYIILYDISSSIMRALPCTVSGTTVTQGTVTSTATTATTMQIFDGVQIGTDLVILLGKLASTGYMSGVIVSVSGTVATFNTFYGFGNITVTAARVGELTPQSIYVFENLGTGNGVQNIKTYFFTFNTTTKKIFNTSTEIMDITGNQYGQCKWREGRFLQGRSVGASDLRIGVKNNNGRRIVGKVKSSGAADATANIETVGPVLSGYTGLQESMEYYLPKDGSTINIDNDGVSIGLSISPTEILRT